MNKQSTPKNFSEFVRIRIEGMKNGSIRRKGNRYSKQTISSYIGFHSILTWFEISHPLSWENINDSMIEEFICFLEERGYLKKTINKNLAIMRSMLNCAMHEGYNFDNTILARFPQLQVKREDTSVGIYLTEDELQALFEMKLTKIEEKARDVFLVGCYTSQRFSDYSRIDRNCFSVNDGIVIITLTQQKTGREVSIPVLNDNLLRIFERWDYKLPAISISRLNFNMKKILKRLSEDVPSLRRERLTRMTVYKGRMEGRTDKQFRHTADGRVYLPRYMMVSSHTARRTGITLMYLSKVLDTREMMSISGHKTESVFNEYIKISGIEMATEIAHKIRDASTVQVTKSNLIQQLEELSVDQLSVLIEASKKMLRPSSSQ